jgi:hypothetical protein
MSTLFIDGFEQFKNAASPPLPDALERAGYTRTGSSFLTLAGRLGGTALSLSDSSVTRRLPWSGRYFSAGAAVFMYARNAILTLKLPSGATLACAWIDAVSGIPHLNGVEGGSAPAMKVWYYIELVLDRQSQTMSLLINNRAEVTNIPMPTAGLTASELLVVWGTATPAELPGMESLPDAGGITNYDDVYAHDAQRLGAMAITTRFPTANAGVTWMPVPDTKNNWEIVSNVPPVPLDENVSNEVVGETDAYVSNKALVNNNVILATGICILARKSSLLNVKLGVFIGNNAAAARRDAVLTPDLHWTTRYQAFYQVVGDTKSGIETAPFGFLIAPP